MTERLTYRDLDLAELQALLARQVTFFSQSDLLWAKWEVVSQKALDMFPEIAAADEADHRAFDAYMARRDAKTLGAWEAARAKAKRLRAKQDRLERQQEELHRRHREAVEARS